MKPGIRRIMRPRFHLQLPPRKPEQRPARLGMSVVQELLEERRAEKARESPTHHRRYRIQAAGKGNQNHLAEMI
jgi:hypothetical protein